MCVSRPANRVAKSGLRGADEVIFAGKRRYGPLPTENQAGGFSVGLLKEFALGVMRQKAPEGGSICRRRPIGGGQGR